MTTSNYQVTIDETTQKLFNFNCSLIDMAHTLCELKCGRNTPLQQEEKTYDEINKLIRPLQEEVRAQLIENIRENVYMSYATL